MRRIILFCIMSVGLILSLSIALAQDKVVVIPLFDDCDDCTGNATSADVLSGKTFSNSSGKGLTGTRPPAPVEKSGVTNCYDTSGTAIDCSGTGQDGEHQKGIAWPNPRFTDNQDGTVTDNLTGLIWLKNANCTAFFSGDSNGENERSWSDALTAANSLADGYCGLTDGSVAGDWRLPNVKELQRLIHYGFYYPVPNTAGTGKWTEGDPFTGVQLDYYWSGSTYAVNTSHAWVVVMNVGCVYSLGKSDGGYVWPVRGGN